MVEMDETLLPETRITIKKYAGDIPVHEGGDWTVSESTNKIFILNLKRYKADAHRVVSQRYKTKTNFRSQLEQQQKLLKTSTTSKKTGRQCNSYGHHQKDLKTYHLHVYHSKIN